MTIFIRFCLISITAGISLVSAQSQRDPNINWMSGPTIANMGDNLAQIRIDSNYAFADARDTKKVMELMGNPSHNQELGMVIPKNEGLAWFVLFEYHPVGYVNDDDKGKIDAAALLKSIGKQTEESNKEREKMGGTPIHVLSWYKEPYYDVTSHNLSWAILAEAHGDTIANYNTRILSRTGFTSIVLVASAHKLDSIMPRVQLLLADFSYKQGKRYFEFVQGDKIAEYGLTALIAGGAGAAAVKFGFFKFLAKFIKPIILAVLAAIGGFFKWMKNIFRKKSEKVA